jgi:hypothetical protein
MSGIEPWPYPGDSPLNQRERIARSYRQELEKVAPAQCAALDSRCLELGHGWIAPQQLIYRPDDQLTAQQVAEMCGVKLATVRQWRKRGLRTLTTVDGMRYRVADVMDYHAVRRRRRVERVQAARTRATSGL